MTSVCLMALLCAGNSAAPPPNIIVILCDNLGYGDVEPFWSETPHRTPSLNRMSREGRRFTHFYVSAGVCTPSRASLLTGCYAQRLGLHRIPVDDHVLRPVSPYGLHPDEITIAEVLKPCGYATKLIGKWHLGDQPGLLPTDQGFDSWFGIPYSDDMTAREWKGRVWPKLPLMQNARVIEAPADRNTLTRRYTDRAVAFIRQNRQQPFFLLLSHAMPGSTKTPYASEDFQGRSRNGRWGDSVEEIDWSTGQVLDVLEELNLADRTLVIWTSDNGAPSNAGDLARGTNRPLSGRGYTTTEGGMRVPTIAWWPGRVPAGTTSDQLATTMDLLPTFAHLAGADPPGDRRIDGRDIAPLLFGEPAARTPHEAFYYYQQNQLQAVRSGPWKLYLPLDRPHRHGRHRRGPTPTELFNVVSDAACVENVAAEHPEIVARLTQLAEAARAELGDRDRPGTGQRTRGEVQNPTARVASGG